MNLGIEDEILEFKKTIDELDEAMVSICAMLNKHGKGTIYFGVHPNGEVVGQEITEATLRDVSRKIYESITPSIIPQISKKMFDDKAVIEVTFFGNEKPYSCKGVYYIRTADEDRVLPPNELRHLFEYNRAESWDREITDYTIKDIDLNSFKKFYNKAVACNRLKDTNSNPDEVLKRLGLIVNDHLTNAAVYLFSSLNPITLKMAVFATEEKMTFLDINRVKGNIIDLIDIASNYVKEKILWKADIVGMSRIEIPEIPIKSLREIICNSFAHARYNTFTEHEIDIHPNKIVIYNPGAFPIGYNPEDFVNQNLQSMVRNPLILDTLYLSEDVETYSSGLKKVYSECKEKAIKIEYIKYQDGFAFIFNRKNGINQLTNKTLTENEKKMLSLLKQSPKTSINEFAKEIGKSSRTIQRTLNNLKAKGYIERIGGTKGYWNIII